MAKVAVPFFGVPDGETQPRQFVAGDEVTGDLARVAAAEGWLEPERPTAIATTGHAAHFAGVLAARLLRAIRGAFDRFLSWLN